MASHPLVNKYVVLVDNEEGYYSISRFVENMGIGLMLAVRVSTRTGKDLPAMHVISLLDLSQEDLIEVFDSFESLKANSRAVPDNTEDDNTVVKLVPRNSC